MPKRNRDEIGRFTKGTRDIDGDSAIYLRMPKRLATDIRGLAGRLNITLSEVIRIACERLIAATDLPEPKTEEKRISFKFRG